METTEQKINLQLNTLMVTNSLVKDIYDMLSESSLNIQDINKVINIVRSKF